MLLLESIYWREPAEIARKASGAEKYTKELAEEKTQTEAFIERLTIKYKKEAAKRLSAIKRAHAAKYSKLLRAYREAATARAVRASKISKDASLAAIIPAVNVPEKPERIKAVLPKRGPRVIKFKQHLKADPRDLLWRNQSEIRDT